MKVRTETVFGGAMRKQGSNGKTAIHPLAKRQGSQAPSQKELTQARTIKGNLP